MGLQPESEVTLKTSGLSPSNSLVLWVSLSHKGNSCYSICLCQCPYGVKQCFIQSFGGGGQIYLKWLLWESKFTQTFEESYSASSKVHQSNFIAVILSNNLKIPLSITSLSLSNAHYHCRGEFRWKKLYIVVLFTNLQRIYLFVIIIMITIIMWFTLKENHCLTSGQQGKAWNNIYTYTNIYICIFLAKWKLIIVSKITEV